MSKKGNNSIVVAVLFVLLALSALVGVSYFGYSAWSDLSEIAVEYERARMQEEERLGLAALLRATEVDRGALERFDVRRSEIVIYLETIEAAAREAGLVSEVRSVDVRENEETKATELFVEQYVSGEFGAIYNYLLRVEVLPYMAYVESVTMQYEADGGWSAAIVYVAPRYIDDEAQDDFDI